MRTLDLTPLRGLAQADPNEAWPFARIEAKVVAIAADEAKVAAPSPSQAAPVAKVTETAKPKAARAKAAAVKKRAKKKAAPMSSAAKVAAFRARKRAAGMCPTCGQRKPAQQRQYCQECIDAAAERVKRSRAETR